VFFHSVSLLVCCVFVADFEVKKITVRVVRAGQKEAHKPVFPAGRLLLVGCGCDEKRNSCTGLAALDELFRITKAFEDLGIPTIHISDPQLPKTKTRVYFGSVPTQTLFTEVSKWVK
jgi:hypothetical protein